MAGEPVVGGAHRGLPSSQFRREKRHLEAVPQAICMRARSKVGFWAYAGKWHVALDTAKRAGSAKDRRVGALRTGCDRMGRLRRAGEENVISRRFRRQSAWRHGRK